MNGGGLRIDKRTSNIKTLLVQLCAGKIKHRNRQTIIEPYFKNNLNTDHTGTIFDSTEETH